MYFTLLVLILVKAPEPFFQTPNTHQKLTAACGYHWSVEKTYLELPIPCATMARNFLNIQLTFELLNTQ